MNCPTCHQEIPRAPHGGAPLLTCPACLKQKGHQALLELQRHYVRRILDGRYQLTLTAPAQEVRLHLAMAGAPSAGWCGMTLNKRWKKKQLFYSKIDFATVCVQCAEVFDQLGKEERGAGPITQTS